jgi:predicted amidophosphoribosyltransferase
MMKCKACGKRLSDEEERSGYQYCEKCAKRLAKNFGQVASHIIRLELPSFGELQMPHSPFDD